MPRSLHAKQADLLKMYSATFGTTQGAIIVRSPGRINIIGEHTDYNEGFVLPSAIDLGICFIIGPRSDGELRCLAADMNDSYTCSLGTIRPSAKIWPNYLAGVVDQIQKTGRKITGCNVVFGGDIPIGAGLSSSAAVEGGFAFALNTLFSLGLSPMELVHIAQNAEKDFVGVRCGIMDQFINIFGKEKSVLKLDCRSLAYEYFPFDNDEVRFVLCDTGVRRQLAASEYNMRRNQCETGVAVLRKGKPAVKSLRDVGLAELEDIRPLMDPVIYRRCDYVVRENARVTAVCDALTAKDLRTVGRLMYESHDGLRDGYEVSCRELDVLVEIASGIGGVIGARMMGAGFGGCTLNLIERERCDEFTGRAAENYKKATGRSLQSYTVRIRGGTEGGYESSGT